MREQIVVLERRLATSEAPLVRERLDTVGAELGAIRGELIDVRYTEAQLWPTGLHEKLNALFDAVDSAASPARQMQELFNLCALSSMLCCERCAVSRSACFLGPEQAMNLANLAPLEVAKGDIMLTLLRSLRSRPVYLSEPVSFLTALVIAEIFYKFHSFLLETGASS